MSFCLMMIAILWSHLKFIATGVRFDISPTPAEIQKLMEPLSAQAKTSGQLRTPPIYPKLSQVPKVSTPDVSDPSLQSVQITADDAAMIALKTNPVIVAAEAQVLAASGSVESVSSGLKPLFSLSTSYGQQDNFYGPASVNSGSQTSGSNLGSSSPQLGGYSSTISIRQLIFDFGHTLDAVRQAKAAQRSSHLSLMSEQSLLVEQTKAAFYAWQQAVNQTQVDQADFVNRQAQLDLANALLKSGIGPPANVATAQTALALSSTTLSLAQQAAITARIQLASFMGIDPRTPLTPEASVEPNLPMALPDLVKQALSKRNEVLKAQSDLGAARLQLSAAKTSDSPALSLTLGVSARGTSDPLASDTSSYSAGLSWEFGDGGLAAGLIKQAQAAVLTAQANLTATQLSVRQDVVNAWVALQASQQRLAIAGSEVANAQESLRLAEGSFQAGTETFIDVTTAQTALQQAQSDAVAAQAAVEQSKVLLRHAIGD